MGEKYLHRTAMMASSSAMNVLSLLFIAFMFLTWDVRDLPFILGLSALLIFLLVCPFLSILTIYLYIRERKRKVLESSSGIFLVLALLYPLYFLTFIIKLSTFKIHVM